MRRPHTVHADDKLGWQVLHPATKRLNIKRAATPQVVDNKLMNELKTIKNILQPQEVLP